MIARGVSVLREEGISPLLEDGFAHLKWRVGSPDYWRCRLRGTRTVRVGDRDIELSVNGYRGDYRQLRFFEKNEQEQLADVLSEARTDDTFLDVGANIGIYSLFLDQVVEDVHAVEPHPVNVTHLLMNVDLNGGDVDIYNCALSDSNDYIGLEVLTSEPRVDGTAAIGEFGRESDAFTVRAEKGHTLLQKHDISPPNVAKIDAEGAERSIIDGLEDTLERPECRVLYCETHPEETEPETLAAKLESLGFTVGFLGSGSGTIKATKDR